MGQPSWWMQTQPARPPESELCPGAAEKPLSERARTSTVSCFYFEVPRVDVSLGMAACTPCLPNTKEMGLSGHMSVVWTLLQGSASYF